jgi:formate hydrogenlyase subunit 6/NADH:ubiquinone oxidoreductase subunit I
MQPEMSYEKGYCRPECNICSEVCPAGAIRPVSIEEKSSIQIGHAVVNLDLCVVNTDDVDCGNCARHCPAGAISMVRKDSEDMNSRLIPAVNEEMCIGCGACENLCPAKPLAAIHVEGHEVHKTI